SPDEETVDSAAGQAALLGRSPPLGVLFQQPTDLGGREIRIQNQARSLVEPSFVALVVPAKIGRAPILPNDGPGDRPAAGAVPEDRCFALVGDTDRGYIAGVDPGGGQRLRDDVTHGLPNLFGIV